MNINIVLNGQQQAMINGMVRAFWREAQNLWLPPILSIERKAHSNPMHVDGIGRRKMSRHN